MYYRVPMQTPANQRWDQIPTINARSTANTKMKAAYMYKMRTDPQEKVIQQQHLNEDKLKPSNEWMN